MKKVRCRPVVRKHKPLHPDESVRWKMSAPFVVNKRAVLVHRVRSASSHEGFRTHLPHHLCLCWCGSGFNSGGLEFVDDPPTERLLCARCEMIAVAAGEVPTDTLVGRHVCKGVLKAHRTCCSNKTN